MRIITSLLFLCLSFLLHSQEYFPKNDGVKQSYKNTIALTNATIYISAVQKIENATLLFKDDIILEIGTNVAIPKNATVIDAKGKTIYPSFVEIFSEFGIAKPNKSPRSGYAPQYDSEREGYYWNDHIKTDYNVYQNLKYNEVAASELRQIGFGTVLSHLNDGIIAGTGMVWTLNDTENNAKRILNTKLSQHYTFKRSDYSRQSYPSSLMGSMALIRQVYHDAKWYAQGSSKTKDLSLEFFNANKGLLQIFNAGDKLNILRAAKIGSEFGVNYLIKGSGNEFERIEDIKKTGATIIVPLDFPEAYDVSDPYLAQQVSVSDMKFWNQAPFNLKILADNNVPFIITSSDLKDSKSFLENLRKAVLLGLPKEKALAALTEIPAKTMNLSDKVGTLKKGALANFLITSGDLFDKETFIYENWVQGNQNIIKKMDIADINGTYSLAFDGKKYNLELSGEPATLNAKTTQDSIHFGTKLTFNDPWVNMLIRNQDTVNAGYTRLSGTYLDGTITGKAVLEDGKELPFIAVRKIAQSEDKKTNTDTLSDILSAMYPVTFPNTAFGNKIKPIQENILFKNATVWTSENEGILTQTDVYVSNGKISKIGKNLQVANAKIVDATGKHLTAGIIDEHSHIAISNGVNEGGQNSSAEVTIEDVVNSEDINIYRNLAGGVTSSNLLHGSANPIGGRAAFVKLKWGYNPEEMIVKDAPKYIKFALGENVKQSNWGSYETTRFPQSRMGVEQVYEDYFTRAIEYQKEWAAYKVAKGKNKLAPRFDVEMEVLNEILNKKRFITCHSYVQSEINMLMKLAERYNFKIQTFTHILEGYKLADKMAAHGVAGSTFADWWAYKFEVNDAIPYNASLMQNQGVLVSINSDDAEMSRRLNQEAAKSIKYGGMTEEEAWKLVTLNPAKILQVDSKIGSIKVGKDADLVLWTDNPLSIYAKAEKTIIDGTIFYDLEKENIANELIQKERAALINLMLDAKNKGLKTQTPKQKPVGHYHCDTQGEFCKISHYKHF